MIVSGSEDYIINIWNVITGKLINTLVGHTDSVYSVAWSRKDKKIVSGSGDATVKIWNAVTGKLINTLRGHTDSVYSVAWSRSG